MFLFSTKTKQTSLSFGLDGIKQMKPRHFFSTSTKPKQIAFSFLLVGTKQMKFYDLVMKQNKTKKKKPRTK